MTLIRLWECSRCHSHNGSDVPANALTVRRARIDQLIQWDGETMRDDFLCDDCLSAVSTEIDRWSGTRKEATSGHSS